MTEYHLYGDPNGNALDRLKASRPQLISKLYYWASKRLQFRISHSLVAEEDIGKQVDKYLEPIAFASSDLELRQAVRIWEDILSAQEKAIVGKFFPFELPYISRQLSSWFMDSNWYSLRDGQYITAEEEVLDGITYQGQQTAIITKNAYEADILNVKNMMIVDVDLEGDQAIAINIQSALDALKSVVENSSSNFGFRAYRTAAGLRYICTTHEWETTQFLSDKIMRNLFADDRYRALCKFQDTYRARLTPKPWRASDIAWRNRGKWDLDDDWVGQFRVCQPCEQFIFGNTQILPQFAEAIAYHDRVTRAFGDQDLILA